MIERQFFFSLQIAITILYKANRKSDRIRRNRKIIKGPLKPKDRVIKMNEVCARFNNILLLHIKYTRRRKSTYLELFGCSRPHGIDTVWRKDQPKEQMAPVIG